MVVRHDHLHRGGPVKKLLEPLPKSGGRNSSGKITVRHHGGGAKQFYRVVDFRQERLDQPAEVLAVEYDPNRTAHIARVRYPDGALGYVLAPEGLRPGVTIIASRGSAPLAPGNRMPLDRIPPGTGVFNVELTPGRGGAIVRAAGSAATLLVVEGPFAQIRLPSGEVRKVPKDAMATVGQVSNTDHRNVRLGKAGRMRHRGIRPRVRGKAMNPVDHPHGGGEGNQPVGLKHPKTPWGKPALGVKTRRRPRFSDHLIVKRRR
jgi:large subunit ribosomal protein L2